jgi:hypothetical protein
MPNSRFMPRHGTALFGALAGLIILATSAEKAIGDKPSTPVTVTNPDTSPVPTTVTNPSTTPALTSSVDDPGRVAYQSIANNVCAPPPNPIQCVVDFPAVPQGHRLVIQDVSGSVKIFTSATSAEAIILSDGKLVSSFFIPVGVGDISVFDNQS